MKKILQSLYEEISTVGPEGYFALVMVWVLLGWSPWFIFMETYLLVIGAESIAVTHPLNVTVFFLSYLFAPLWLAIICWPIWLVVRLAFRLNVWVIGKVIGKDEG